MQHLGAYVCTTRVATRKAGLARASRYSNQDFIDRCARMAVPETPGQRPAFCAFLSQTDMRMTMDLSLPRPGRCKWAEGDTGNYTFPCNQRVDAGVSYCTDHRALVYMPPEERRRSKPANNSASFKRIAA